MSKTHRILAAFAAVAPAFAGPLDPPSGPITSTYKTLTEVEPRTAVGPATTPGDADSVFKITQSGSYYLTADVVGALGRHGIEVAAANVTIDLNGFTVRGVPGALSGIVTPAPAERLRVAGGVVRDWPQNGISASNSTMVSVEGVHAIANLIGISVGDLALVHRCVAAENTSTGVRTQGGALITDSLASSNAGAGFEFAGVIRGSVALFHSAAGIFSQSSAEVVNCESSNNAGDGISVGGASRVVTSRARSNGIAGIRVGSQSTVLDCTLIANVGDGIIASSDSLIRGNHCDSNGSGTGDGAGIKVTGSDGRIEGNVCTDSDRGLEVTGSGNFITRNSSSGNAVNWSIAAGNICVVVNAAVTGAAISGDSGGTAPGSIDPNANFTY